jgi:hypothetical protein
MRLRSAMSIESNIVAELTRIAVFNIKQFIEGGALETGRHPLGVDHPGLAVPFSPETALREVLKRHDFFKYDMSAVKKSLEEVLNMRNNRIEGLSPATIVLIFPILAFRQFALKAGLSGLCARADTVFYDFLSSINRGI